MKKKIFSFICLIIIFIGIIVVLNNGDVNSLTNAVIEVEGFEDTVPIGMAIFCELFVSIHMSVFVLLPIAGVINRNKKVEVFILLFCIRAMILVVGDILNPTVTRMVDFISVFIGAFILVPILMYFKRIKYNGELAYHEYIDVDSRTLAEFGYSDIELLKRVLIDLFVDVRNAFSLGDRKRLLELCSRNKYILYKNELELLEKVGERKKYENFEIEDCKVYDICKDAKGITISVILKVRNLEYVVDEYNKIIKGSNKISNESMLDLMFYKSLQHEEIEECPNCGSPVTKDSLEFCSYCGSELNFNIGELVLKYEKIIEK